MKTFKDFFTLGVSKPSKMNVQKYLDDLGSARRLLSIPDIIKKIEDYFKTIKNLKIDRSAQKVLSFEEFNPEINEKTEYYLDTSKDNTEKYVANDGDYWYTGRVGMKAGSSFLKFVATSGKDSYFESTKLKKVSPKEMEKEALKKPTIISTVDFKKLYKR